MNNTLSQTYKMRSAAIASRLHDIVQEMAGNISSNFEVIQLDNGLLQTSNGYYAICQDRENNNTVVLYADDQKHFETNKFGQLKSIESVYVVPNISRAPQKDRLPRKKGNKLLNWFKKDTKTARKRKIAPYLNVDQISEIVSKDHKSMKRFGIMENSLTGGDVSKAYGNGQSKIYMFANEKISFTIRKHDSDGKWSVRAYIPFNRINIPYGFPEIDAADPDKLLIKTGFSNGFEYGRYETAGEAFANFVMTWDKRSQNNYNGDNMFDFWESPLKVFQVAVYNAFVSEISNEDNIKMPAFETGVGLVGSFWTAGKLLGLTTASAIGGSILITFAKQKTLELIKQTYKAIDWKIRGTKSTHPDVAQYIATDKKNQKRNRLKPCPDLAKKLRVLKLEDMPPGGMSHDQRPIFKSVENKRDEKKQKTLSRKFISYENRMRPQVNMIVGQNSFAQICTNGVVRRVKRDFKTWNKVADTTYVPAFNLNHKIEITGKENSLLSENNVIRFWQMENTNTQKGDFYLERIANNNFKRSVSTELRGEPTQIDTLKWMFDVQADQEPQAIPDAHYPLSFDKPEMEASKAEKEKIKKVLGHAGTDDNRPKPSAALLARCKNFTAPDISKIIMTNKPLALNAA